MAIFDANFTIARVAIFLYILSLAARTFQSYLYFHTFNNTLFSLLFCWLFFTAHFSGHHPKRKYHVKNNFRQNERIHYCSVGAEINNEEITGAGLVGSIATGMVGGAVSAVGTAGKYLAPAASGIGGAAVGKKIEKSEIKLSRKKNVLSKSN